MINTIVTKSNKLMRSEARSYLSGNWKKAVLATIVFILIANGPTFLSQEFFAQRTSSILSMAYSIFVGAPMTFGFLVFILKLIRGQNSEMSDLFEGFNNYSAVIILGFITGLFIILWSLLLVVPGIIAALRYSQAYFILIDNPSMRPSEALDKSKELMRGNVGKLFILFLSFIGWALLSVITFGIAGLWVIPYIYVTFAIFYKELLGHTINDKNLDNTVLEETLLYEKE